MSQIQKATTAFNEPRRSTFGRDWAVFPVRSIRHINQIIKIRDIVYQEFDLQRRRSLYESSHMNKSRWLIRYVSEMRIKSAQGERCRAEKAAPPPFAVTSRAGNQTCSCHAVLRFMRSEPCINNSANVILGVWNTGFGSAFRYANYCTTQCCTFDIFIG